MVAANPRHHGLGLRFHRLSKLFAVSHCKSRSETPSQIDSIGPWSNSKLSPNIIHAAIQTIFMSGTILLENSELQHDSF